MVYKDSMNAEKRIDCMKRLMKDSEHKVPND